MEFISIRYFIFCLLLLSMVECKKSKSKKSSKSKKIFKPKKPDLPNIVVILHELSWNDIGYNNHDVLTPTMNKLASTGVKLDHYYTLGFSHLARTHLLTGKHWTTLGLQPDKSGPSRPWGLPLGTLTMADRLKEKKYATHFVGKWHLGHSKKEYTPTYRGFDTFYGFYNGSMKNYDYLKACPENASDWGYGKCMWDNAGENIAPIKPQYMVGTYEAGLFKNRAVRNIDRHDKSKPLFMVVAPRHVKADHLPQGHIDLYDIKSHRLSLGLRKRFAQSTILDDLVGDVVEALKFNKIWDNTVLAVLAENSGNSKALWKKHSLSFGLSEFVEFAKKPAYYKDATLRGNCFLHSPLLKKSREGAVVTDLVHISDMFPTLLHAAGIKDVENEADIYGKNMWPVISNGEAGTREDVLHFLIPDGPLEGEQLYKDTFDTRRHACFTDGDLKLKTGYTAEWKKTYFLYNMTSDPKERTDLSDNPVYTSRLRTMLDKLQTYYNAATPSVYFEFGKERIPESCPRHHGYFAPWQ